MNIRTVKLYAWLASLFAANIIVYTVVFFSRRPSRSGSISSIRSISGIGRKSARRATVVIMKNKLWRQHNLVSLPLWELMALHLEMLQNPILKNTKPKFNLTFPESCSDPFESAASQVLDFYSYPEAMKNFVLAMHCRNYSLLIHPLRVCDQNPNLLLAIKSQVGNFNQRQAIRETWGGSGKVGNYTVKTVFLLGKQDPDIGHPDLNFLLDYETRRKGDILLWDFHDTFFNLTLKDILFLQWLEDGHCPSVEFIFKGDDDIYLSTENLIAYISGLNKSESLNLFTGNVIPDAQPIHDRKDKYFIPESFYNSTYPPYASGGGVLYTRNMASQLYSATHDVILYPIDDVYLGMCLSVLGVDPQFHGGFRTFDISKFDRSKLCIYKNVIMVHKRTPQQTLKLLHQIHNQSLTC